MREILFRGKRIDNGEWIEGDYRSPWRDVPPHIVCNKILDNKRYAADVDPDTVGQYTGLKDKNGKRIFEGDVVQYYGTYALEVFIENGHAKIRWFDTATNRKCQELFFGYDAEADEECEIIGNIHDNPELIGGTE